MFRSFLYFKKFKNFSLTKMPKILLSVALTILLFFKNDFQCDSQQQDRLNHLQRERMINYKLNGNAPFSPQNFLGCDCTNIKCDRLSLAPPPSENKCTFICCFEMKKRERRLNYQNAQRGMRGDRDYPIERGPLDHDLEL
jgi:hypothetical protein